MATEPKHGGVAQRIKEEVQGLLTQQQEYDNQVAAIDEGLRQTRRALTWGEDDGYLPPMTKPTTTVIPAKPATASPKSSKKSPKATPPKKKKVSGGDSAKDRAYSILRKSGKDTPLDEAEIGFQMTKDGYETDLPPDEFVQFVYTDCIHPLIREGLVESVGTQPHRKYRVK